MEVATDQTVRNAIEMKLSLFVGMREFTQAIPVSFTLCETRSCVRSVLPFELRRLQPWVREKS